MKIMQSIKQIRVKNAVPKYQLALSAVLTVLAAALADGLDAFEILIQVLQLPEVVAFLEGLAPPSVTGVVGLAIAFVLGVLRLRKEPPPPEPTVTAKAVAKAKK